MGSDNNRLQWLVVRMKIGAMPRSTSNENELESLILAPTLMACLSLILADRVTAHSRPYRSNVDALTNTPLPIP